MAILRIDYNQSPAYFNVFIDIQKDNGLKCPVMKDNNYIFIDVLDDEVDFYIRALKNKEIIAVQV